MERPATIRYDMLPVASRRRDKTATAPGRSPRRYVVRIVAVPAVLSLLYFGVLGSLMQRVDARTDFVPTAAVENGSHAVNMAEALIVREVGTHRWAPNDPVFFPTAFHDNMGNFQRGLLAGKYAMAGLRA